MLQLTLPCNQHKCKAVRFGVPAADSRYVKCSALCKGPFGLYSLEPCVLHAEYLFQPRLLSSQRHYQLDLYNQPIRC